MYMMTANGYGKVYNLVGYYLCMSDTFNINILVEIAGTNCSSKVE